MLAMPGPRRASTHTETLHLVSANHVYEPEYAYVLQAARRWRGIICRKKSTTWKSRCSIASCTCACTVASANARFKHSFVGTCIVRRLLSVDRAQALSTSSCKHRAADLKRACQPDALACGAFTQVERPSLIRHGTVCLFVGHGAPCLARSALRRCVGDNSRTNKNASRSRQVIKLTIRLLKRRGLEDARSKRTCSPPERLHLLGLTRTAI